MEIEVKDRENNCFILFLGKLILCLELNYPYFEISSQFSFYEQ